MIKFYTKYRQEKEAFLRRAVHACAKEFRKKVMRRGKGVPTQRARKLAKEVQAFWKRQDRELVDAKRKKEKQLRELRRQEEERREAELQRKRFQFLLRESRVYADFMARKMGVRSDGAGDELEDEEDEARVQREVSAVIA